MNKVEKSTDMGIQLFLKIKKNVSYLIIFSLFAQTPITLYSNPSPTHNIEVSYSEIKSNSVISNLVMMIFLEMIINKAQEKNMLHSLPSNFMEVYQLIKKINEINPEYLEKNLKVFFDQLISNITEKLKGVRPDAPSATANNALVGPGSCDLAPVLQFLNLIKCKLEECCDDLEQDFRETWTILADITDSSTICCELLQQDFQGTFSALDACCEQILNEVSMLVTPTIVINLTDTVTIILHQDNQETWTILADIKETLTECCADIAEDFRETWTILADITDSSTICCDLLQEDFRQTWTLIEGVQERLCRKFEETWTILADINDSSTICCADLQEDFRETWTLIEEVQETLCTKFEETWTVLADINLSLTECCADIAEDFRETWTLIEGVQETLCDKFEQTWTILDIITSAMCNPTIIRQADFGVGGTSSLTISTSGLYIFGEDITFNGALAVTPLAIIINASNVRLDLCGFTLQQGDAAVGIDGIRINSTRDNVIIENGIIDNFTGVGISVQGNNDNTTIRNINVISCQTRGIELDGVNNDTMIMNCKLLACSNGVSADHVLFIGDANNAIIENCVISNSNNVLVNLSGIRVESSSECIFEDIEILNNSGNNYDGISLATVSQCLFKNCNVINNTANAGFTGFLFFSNCSNNILKDCSVLNNSNTSNGMSGFAMRATTITQHTFENCRALDNNGAGTTLDGWLLVGNGHILIDCNASNNTGAYTNVRGYRITASNNGLLLRCTANNNSNTLFAIGARAIGLNLAGTAPTNWTIKECQFANNTAISAAFSFGIRIDTGSNNLFTKNVAFNNSTTPGNQLSGFAATQKQDVLDTTINSATLPWTNVGVT